MYISLILSNKQRLHTAGQTIYKNNVPERGKAKTNIRIVMTSKGASDFSTYWQLILGIRHYRIAWQLCSGTYIKESSVNEHPNNYLRQIWRVRCPLSTCFLMWFIIEFPLIGFHVYWIFSFPVSSAFVYRYINTLYFIVYGTFPFKLNISKYTVAVEKPKWQFKQRRRA